MVQARAIGSSRSAGGEAEGLQLKTDEKSYPTWCLARPRLVPIVIMIVLVMLPCLLLLVGRGDDMVGNPRRARVSLVQASRAYPLAEIRQTVPCRTIRGNSISVNSTLPPLLSLSGCSVAIRRPPKGDPEKRSPLSDLNVA